MATADTTDDSNGIYSYKPNSSICIVAAILFGSSAFFHVFQMIRKRTWFYTPLVIGSFMMTLGYVLRYFSAKTPSSLMLYVGQSLLIILPPSLYAATIYMIYGRIAVFVNAPGASIIQPTKVTKIFVIGDVISFWMQAGGGGMMAQASMANMGKYIMLGGLFAQLIFFGFFLIVSIIFWKRMRSSPARYTTPSFGKRTWMALLKLLFIAATLIIFRCGFRIIESSQGITGYFASHEVYMYLFDAAPMFIVQAMFNFVHAGDVFPRRFTMGKLADNNSEVHIGLRDRT